MSYIGNVNAFESVGTSDLEDGSVIAAKIADSAITTAKLADSAITTAKLAASAITTAKVADGAITAAKINSAVALGGPSLGTGSIVRTNLKSIGENIVFAGNENGSTVGPVEIQNNFTVTVTNGSTWIIL